MAQIGPAYSREEWLDRLGFVAGVTLPFWNRNRKGIAETEGARDEAKQEAIRIWRDESATGHFHADGMFHEGED